MTKSIRATDPEASNAPPTDDVLNTPEAAAYLKTTTAQLTTMRYKGLGPIYVRTPGGRSIRYLRSDLEKWLEAGRVQTDNSRRA